MDQRTTEIKAANRKARPKFILICAICGILGGIAGVCIAAFDPATLVAGLTAAGQFFARYMAPWLMLVCAITRLAVCIPMYRSAKKLVRNWDGEDEELPDRVDRKLSVCLWINTALFIVSCFFMAAAGGGLSQMENLQDIILWGVCLLSYVVNLVSSIMLERRMVDLTKRLQPEKNGSVYDLNFQKKWMDSCDEAEKLLMGQCAMKAHTATQYTCMALWLIAAISALFLGTGLFPVLLVCIIWGVSLFTYNYYAKKLAQPGRLIR